ncbi:MAG: flagellar hook protein FlgE [Sphingomonadales bacterium]|jgi:flagellar hook protein FlgE
MTFYTALTGLNGAQTEMATIANNIANVGTVGFKRSKVSFGDIISTSPKQNPSRLVGSGTSVRGIQMQFGQGPMETSSSAIDMAISGQGFFVVKSPDGAGNTSYTRNGNFSVTSDRFVVDSLGRRLHLFPTSSDGNLRASDLGSTIPARLPLTSGAPKATSRIDLTVNLPADADVIANRPVYTAANPYVFDPTNPNTYNASSSQSVYDSLGNPLAATIYYVKDSLPSAGDPTHRWTARVFVGDQELSVGGTPGIPMVFNTSGTLTSPTAPFTFDTVPPPRGGDPLSITINHGNQTGQVAGPFSAEEQQQDGFPSGQLESVAVGSDGTLRVSFSNGEVQIMGKVAMATFSNPQGLKQVGDAHFVTTPESGVPITGEAGSNGIGNLLSGSLERSNVDLTTELVGLIAAQRNFQASAKAIETDSQLLQTVINIRS